MMGTATKSVSDSSSKEVSDLSSKDVSGTSTESNGAASKPKRDCPRRRPKKVIHLNGFTMEDILAHMRQVYSEGVAEGT